MLRNFVLLLAVGWAFAVELGHVDVLPRLDPAVPLGVPVIADAPLAVSATAASPLNTLQLVQPIEIAEPIVLAKDLEERQDTVVRQTSSSGKLQHILRAHYVGNLDNEQRFEAQDAAEPAALPRTPRVSLNEYFFNQPPPVIPIAPVAPAPASYWPPSFPGAPVVSPGPGFWPPQLAGDTVVHAPQFIPFPEASPPVTVVSTVAPVAAPAPYWQPAAFAGAPVVSPAPVAAPPAGYWPAAYQATAVPQPLPAAAFPFGAQPFPAGFAAGSPLPAAPFQ